MLTDDPESRRDWDRMALLDLLGRHSFFRPLAHPPTTAACRAHLDLPKLKDMPVDGVIVDSNSDTLTSTCAVCCAWKLSSLSSRLDVDEWQLMRALCECSHDQGQLDPKVRTYIPAVGGCTVYVFGDARKICDPKVDWFFEFTTNTLDLACLEATSAVAGQTSTFL